LDYPKRLIEVDLPIKRISAHARRDKSIRYGHISTLHIWWARRPLAACRAVICAALWPDPADAHCPASFCEEARRLMTDWARDHLDLTSPESMSRFNRVKNDPGVLADNVELRKALLDFIADFANWDSTKSPPFLEFARALTVSAHLALGGAIGTRPLVVDPFAGGGAIPLEALRVGADAFGSDLNPIPVLLNKVALEYIPRYGRQLAEAVKKWGAWIKTEAEKQLGAFYPPEHGGSQPIAYLWARTVSCEGPGCGAEIPLFRSLWLAKKGASSVALRIVPDAANKQVGFEIITRAKASQVGTGTSRRGAATCPCCGYTTPVESVRKQMRARRGGASTARLIAIRYDDPASGERAWRLATKSDKIAVEASVKALNLLLSKSSGSVSPLPDEPLPPEGTLGFRVQKYGMQTWGDLFTPRQALSLITLGRLVREAPVEGAPDFVLAVRTCLALAVDRLADFNASLCVLNSVGGRGVVHVFGRQALPMVWDFMETNPFNTEAANWQTCIDVVDEIIDVEKANSFSGTVCQASATDHPLPDDSVAAFVTDPPYYDAVPYSDLSDFFYVWLKRNLASEYPALFQDATTPKDDECIVDPVRRKGKEFFERMIGEAMENGRRILAPSGVGVVVFAHKSTKGWESLLEGMLAAGWVITGSWPIDTERPGRLRAQDSAALASSVHLVCRPRETPSGALRDDSVGDWRAVLSELPKRIHEWMPRLAEEGVVGADAIFACLGPALEIFSRYSRVEKASGEVVPLREYLEQVWAAVSTEALSMIFRDADAAGLESDARFTAIVLWTLGAGGSSSSESSEDESEDAEQEDEEGESPKGKAAKGGYTLEYDAARKIAQGLGVNLEQIDSVVEVKGDKARLRPVGERATTLFGKAERAEAATKKRGKKATQKKLFDKNAEEGGGTADTVTIGEGVATTPGVTALDRVHQAMLLFASGRADALKRFIVEDGVGSDARFWKLAQSLSALYPAGSDEKRWVDGVLARKKSFGF
jgi:putative DNA methylase